MAVLTANTAFDMTDWNFGNLGVGSTITRHTSFQYFVTGADADTVYQFTGVGLTYDGSNHLTGGTVTGLTVLDGGGDTLYTLTGFALAGTTLATAIANGDSTHVFENTVFSGADSTINGSDADDVLTDTVNNDTINAGDGNDLILRTHAGFSVITGGDGNDTLYISGEVAETTFDGGAGEDTVIVDRTENFLVPLGTSGLSGVENLVFTANVNRVIINGDDTSVGAGQTLHIDGSAMGANARMIFSATGETDGSYDVIGGAANDVLLGGSLADSYHLERGGHDRVHSGDGSDTFFMGAAFDAGDRLDGELGGDNRVILDGNYAAGVTMAAKTISNIDSMLFQAGHSYKIISNDGNISAGGMLTVGGLFLTGSDKLTFDGSAEKDGAFLFLDGANNDDLSGGAGDDTFQMLGGGHNTVHGGGGDDTFGYLNTTFSAAETIDGGAGTADDLFLEGDYSAGVTFLATTMVNVEFITFNAFFDYSLTLNDGNVASGQTLTVDGSSLSDEDTLTIDGSAELDGKFLLKGGDGNDTLIGGAKADTLTGGLGADLLRGGLGKDVYAYTTVADSTGPSFDTIDGFSAQGDLIDVSVAVTGIDATVTGGRLSDATFNADLSAKLDNLHLLAHHAVLFKPGSGDHAGEVFLVIDQDGSSGYSAGADVVIELTGAAHLSHLDAGDFF